MAITILASKPTRPVLGDAFIDPNTFMGYMWDGNTWIRFSGENRNPPSFEPPTFEQLEKYPALKQAWEEFLVVKKLLGV